MVGCEVLDFTGKAPLWAARVTRGNEGLEWPSWTNQLLILVAWGGGTNLISTEANFPCFPHFTPNW